MENPLQIIQTFNITEYVSMKINDGQNTFTNCGCPVVHSKTLFWAKPKLMESHNNKGKLWLISVVELTQCGNKTSIA
jgi:hypothetical protein